MSAGWLIETRALYQAGGGPVRLARFTQSMGKQPAQAAHRACLKGLMRVTTGKSKSDRLYELTQLGWDLCEGRLKVAHEPGSKRIAFAAVIGASVDDDLIERLLLDAGQIPGQAVRPDVIRRFSAALVAEVRRGA